MSHLDPEQLALLALDEPVATAADRDHLAACRQCAGEIASMRRAAEIARAAADEGAIEAPPDRVWERISAELGLPATGAQAEAAADPGAAGRPGAPADAPAPPRRAARWRGWVLAASLLIVAGVGAGIWALVQSAQPVRIAAASLVGFPGHPGASGTADVDRTRDGGRMLRVTLESAPDEGYREVWLIRSDAAALISLGVLEGSSGSFVIPAGVDLDDYRLVDVSAEPLDGDPAHSGDSIVRGELERS